MFLHVNWWNILCIFCCFITFQDDYFIYLLKAKVIASCATWATERWFFLTFSFRITLLFKIVLLPYICLRFLFLLYAMTDLSWKVVFSLGLICNKCHCLSVISLMFGRVQLNFSTSGILCMFVIFNFVKNKASLVTSGILLNWSVKTFSL